MSSVSPPTLSRGLPTAVGLPLCLFISVTFGLTEEELKKMFFRADVITKKTPTEEFTVALSSLKLASNLPGESANNFIQPGMVFSQEFCTRNRYVRGGITYS